MQKNKLASSDSHSTFLCFLFTVFQEHLRVHTPRAQGNMHCLLKSLLALQFFSAQDSWPIGHRQSPKDIVKNSPNNHFNQVFCLMFLKSKLTSYLDWLFLHLYLGSDCRQTFWFAVMNWAQIFIVSANTIFYSMYVVWPLQTTSLNLGDLFPICVSHQALPTRTAWCSGFRWFWAILKKNSKGGKNMFLSCCYHSKIKADFSQTRTLPTNQLREASNSNLIVKENFLENDTSHYDCIAKQFGIHL